MEYICVNDVVRFGRARQDYQSFNMQSGTPADSWPYTYSGLLSAES